MSLHFGSAGRDTISIQVGSTKFRGCARRGKPAGQHGRRPLLTIMRIEDGPFTSCERASHPKHPMSSRPEELHLRALPEPCMTLSSHTAPDVRPLLEQLCLVHGLLPFPVGQWPRPNNAAPSLQPRYRAFDATTGCSAPVPRFGTLALAVGAACSFSLHVVGRDEAQVLTFHTKAWSSFAPPTCRMPLGRYQGIPRADPGGRVTPRF